MIHRSDKDLLRLAGGTALLRAVAWSVIGLVLYGATAMMPNLFAGLAGASLEVLTCKPPKDCNIRSAPVTLTYPSSRYHSIQWPTGTLRCSVQPAAASGAATPGRRSTSSILLIPGT